ISDFRLRISNFGVFFSIRNPHPEISEACLGTFFLDTRETENL
ncbi:MAG: hypothetical protein H6Q44_1120, partial [Deltaproteobacteria bacterium]|nr:hypothetical protein [Deltaproteobacteria bacterium]